MEDSIFYRLFNTSLLFYSWNQLKSSNYLRSYLRYSGKFPSLSTLWFKKAAFLIKHGRYVYTKVNKLHFLKSRRKSELIIILTQVVIELAFVNLIMYCKRKTLVFDLTLCVRDFMGKLIIFLH